jgi:hypothetical protein
MGGSIAVKTWCVSMAALAISRCAVLARAEAPESPFGTSTTMFLQNFRGPFVDRSLAAELGRTVVSAKYPLAVLSLDTPQVLDQGETWLVTLYVARWTQEAQMIRDVKTIPIVIRKRDAAIIDIFPHDVGSDADPGAVRKRMMEDVACKGCHSRLKSP